MVRSIAFSLCCLILVSFFPVNNIPVENNEDEWKLMINSEGVMIYERLVINSKGFYVKQRKGEFETKCPVTKVWEFLSDDSKTKLWMTDVTDSYLIKKINTNEWYSYLMFKLPWPLENRDLVTHSFSENSGEKITITIKSNEKYLPLKENVTRLTNYKATWNIDKLSGEKVKIILTTQSDDSPVFPRVIQDPIIRNIYFTNLKNLKKLVDS